MYTERFVSESADAADLSAWRRPFKRETNTYRLAQTGKGPPAFRGAALNVGPVKYRGHHTFVVVTTPHDKTVPNVKYPPMTWGLVGVPFYRFAGICKRDDFLFAQKRLRIRPLTWQLLRLDAPANAEFTTSSFVIGEGTESGLWLNGKCSRSLCVFFRSLKRLHSCGQVGERHGRHPGARRLLRVSTPTAALRGLWQNSHRASATARAAKPI